MATQTRRTFETRIDIADDKREELIKLLNARLADTFDLYSQLKQAHWNVKGSDFIQLHLLYDQVAESVLEFVDTIAERATTLGGLALGTARMAAEASTLSEYP
ncbi:MAG TPA: DNA starvation/stationary phase protection protein Dps, partial [Gaiellaceae bacterium]